MTQSIPPEGDSPNQGRSERISRRNFLRGVALAGGVIAVAALGVAGALFMIGDIGNPAEFTTSQTQFTESTCTQSISEPPTVQPVIDRKSGQIKTTDIASNDWRQFVYPRTGCGNVDDDTFKQFAVFHLPRDLTAPSSLAATDPISGDQFIAFSLVCVHLWCLMSYDQSSRLIVCACHNSQEPGSIRTILRRQTSLLEWPSRGLPRKGLCQTT